ncbi:MAG: glycerol kinase, partial [Solirubrobacterales bacterium]
PSIAETTAVGAAHLAGLATGVWRPSDLDSMWREAARYEPAITTDERETLLDGWRRAVERAKGWASA